MKHKLISILVILSVLLSPLSGAVQLNRAQAAGECYIDHTAVGINDGLSWVNAYVDLQLALGDDDCTTIFVAKGTYYPTDGLPRTLTFQLKNGVEIYGGYPNGGGEPDPAAHETILSGDIGVPGNAIDNSYHVVNGSGVGPSAVLDGFTIQDGYADGGGTDDYGGGVYIDSGSPTLRNVIIEVNSALTSGGGMYLFDSSPTLTNVNFLDNDAVESGSWGGGLSIYGVSHPPLSHVEFTGNNAWNGGGMYCEGAGNVQLSDAIFQENIAYQGGGLNLDYCGVSLENVTFDDNTSWGVGGGGMFTLNGTGIFSSTLSQVVFTANYAQSSGGGLYSYSGDISLTDVIFRDNEAMDEGGGLFIDNILSGTFTNLLLSGNSAWHGGGLANYGFSSPEIVNATIYGNHASSAGSAIYNNESSPVLTNSIVWGNTETIPGADIVNSDPTSLPIIATSILEDGCPAGATCTGLVSGDPQFFDPENGDFRLLATSPGIDAGDSAALPTGTTTDLGDRRRVVIERVDLGAYETQLWNTNWTQAAHMSLDEVQPDVHSMEVERYLEQEGQSRWYKISVQPDSKVLVTLTGLPANYDLTLYKDIAQAYNELISPQDLVQLSAEFAPDTFSPDTFSPDTFSPDTFSPDTFSPDTFSPDTFSPDTFSPDTFSPDTYSPDTFSPDTFSPDTFSPDTFSPDTFSPDTYSPDTFSPDTFSPDTFSPDTFSSAQTRSLIALSAHKGTLGEGILVNTWTKSGDFYVRVRGRNGVYDLDHPFHLQITQLSGACGQVNPLLPPSSISPTDGNYKTLILTNLDSTEGSPAEKAALQANLAALASTTAGVVIDVSSDNRVRAAAGQAAAFPACVYAKNLEAYAVKAIVDGFRKINPLEYIVLVGNDDAIPFFRYPDNSLLASETGYFPPVRDNTTSQASLRSGFFLTQDTYGASIEISNKAQTLPVPDLAIGRLVETASDINQVLQAYLNTVDGVIHPRTALVTGYDFLEDAANAILLELQDGLEQEPIDTLIMDSDLSPEDPLAWTADDLHASLLGSAHDIVFLAGHFTASRAQAADYKSRLFSWEVLASTTNFTNSLVYSAGCHSGYNIVNEHGIPNLTEEPDWAQTFAAKGATFIGGTGYQYGDTEFIEYSERLYLDFTRQLRYGTEPVPVGKALAQAKQVYLANTAVMRGIHEKSVLEATLFGLPMFQIDLPGRTTPPVDSSVVSSTTKFGNDPGTSLGLEYFDLSLDITTSEQSLALDVLSDTGADPTQVIAVYLEGPDGVVVNAAEPVLPLEMLNVTSPLPDYVLRGAGWRGGTFTNLPDRLPLTGAATNDLRVPHPAFFSDVFYPVRPWNINYFDALSSSAGPTRLAVMPAQYRSSAPGSLTGTLRRFDTMDFRLYYSGNITTYPTSDPNWPNTPALSAPPDISHIKSTINADGTVSFEVMVVGDPAAGIQEVWIVYTFENGSANGAWTPLDLAQDPNDSRLWRATLALGDDQVEQLRFVVQAANGVGLVTMMTNQGAYYRAGVDPGANPLGDTPVELGLDTLPNVGEFGSKISFSAHLTALGTSLVGVPVAFHLGGQGKMAITGSDGLATANFFLLAQPGDYALSVLFAGNEIYAPASVSNTFELLPGTSSVSLEPDMLEVFYGESPEWVATVTSGGLPLSGKPVALTVTNTEGATVFSGLATTDYAGRARWQVPLQFLGSYTVRAWFGLPVSPELDLSSPYYTGAFDVASLIVYPPDFHEAFDGFFPPVDNPPTVNKVKAGSAVPVKFSLGGDFGLDILASGYPTWDKSTCQAGDISPIEETVTAGESKLVYDPLTGQYTYIWKTDKKWAGTCGSLSFQFIDGTKKEALFQFTR